MEYSQVTSSDQAAATVPTTTETTSTSEDADPLTTEDAVVSSAPAAEAPIEAPVSAEEPAVPTATDVSPVTAEHIKDAEPISDVVIGEAAVSDTQVGVHPSEPVVAELEPEVTHADELPSKQTAPTVDLYAHSLHAQSVDEPEFAIHAEVPTVEELSSIPVIDKELDGPAEPFAAAAIAAAEPTIVEDVATAPIAVEESAETVAAALEPEAPVSEVDVVETVEDSFSTSDTVAETPVEEVEAAAAAATDVAFADEAKEAEAEDTHPEAAIASSQEIKVSPHRPEP